ARIPPSLVRQRRLECRPGKDFLPTIRQPSWAAGLGIAAGHDATPRGAEQGDQGMEAERG
ncbi:MAG: hypothetical protein ACREFZ_11745, partial [Acetobacteraceae bacterium]